MVIEKKYIFTIFFVVLFFGGLFVYIDYHENTHKQIYASYGIPSEIHYLDLEHFNFWDLTATTVPEENYTCNEYCTSNQNIAEIQGYNTISIILNMWLVMTAFILYQWSR